MTTEHRQDRKCLIFLRGRKTGWSGKPSCNSREKPTHNSTHIALVGNQTGVTLVRGERFKQKPTMPQKGLVELLNCFQIFLTSLYGLVHCLQILLSASRLQTGASSSPLAHCGPSSEGAPDESGTEEGWIAASLRVGVKFELQKKK